MTGNSTPPYVASTPCGGCVVARWLFADSGSKGLRHLILFREAYPINVINNVRNVSEVATIYCATSNPVQVIVAKAETSRSVIGIVDGLSSRAIESEDDKQNRSKLLRDLGYKK